MSSVGRGRGRSRHPNQSQPPGRGSTTLNVNAAEYRPSSTIILKEDGDRPDNTPIIHSIFPLLRSTMIVLTADESQYPGRIAALIDSILPIADSSSAVIGLRHIIFKIIDIVEEDGTRAEMAARVINSLATKLGTRGNFPDILESCVMHQARYWNNLPDVLQLSNISCQTAFIQFLASLYVLLEPRNLKFCTALCCLLDVTIRNRAANISVALCLADTYMASLVEDCFQASEDAERELERLTQSIRDVVIQSTIGCSQNAAFALSALETRAGELAKLRFYAQLNLSRHNSEVADDVYDDYEKFLLETGQSNS